MQKLMGIEAIKIFAISWICLYHLLDARHGWTLGLHFDAGNIFSYFAQNAQNAQIFASNISAWCKSFLAFGVMGVNLFVVASGFGLAFSAFKNPNFSALPFFQKRFFRLAIPYWFILTLLLGFVVVAKIPLVPLDFFLHSIFLHTFFPSFTMSLSAPWWFLGMIVQLYLLFPVLFRLAQKFSPLVFLGSIFVVSLPLSHLFYSIFDGGRFFPEFLFDFCLGIFLAKIFSVRPVIAKWWHLLVLFCIFLTGFFILLFFGNEILQFSAFLKFALYHATTSAFFLLIFFGGNFFSFSFLSTLGNLSFSVFLTHHLFLTMIFQNIFSEISFPLAAFLFLGLSFVVGFCFEKTLQFLLFAFQKMQPKFFCRKKLDENPFDALKSTSFFDGKR